MPQSDVEPHFFGTDILHPRFIRDEQQYLSLFARAKSEKRVGEKSAYYLYSRRSAVEIRDFLPSAHIIMKLILGTFALQPSALWEAIRRE